MILELLGSRILAPYLGTSIYIWASLIGVILGALSFGYFLGGRIADLKPQYSYLGAIILAAGVYIGLIPLFEGLILGASVSLGMKWGGIISAFCLFVVPSVLLGMVSPYALRLKIENLKKSGNTSGTLYALSTLGSIFGTFLAGFWLIPHFQLENILFGVSVVLIFSAVFTHSFKNKLFAGFLLLVIFANGVAILEKSNPKYLVEKDSAYNHIRILDSKVFLGRPARYLFLDIGFHSAMYLDKPEELVFGYTKYYRLGDYFNPNIQKALMIGGGGYSVPKDFLTRHQNAKIDVVEIDPEITRLASQYFNLNLEDSRLKIFHEDGRTFLNRNQEKYDVIYNDAFSSLYTVPYQLTTKEAIQEMASALSDQGILIVNVISAMSGEKGEFFRAEYKTLKSVFPQILVFPVEIKDQKTVQNIMIVALKNNNFDLSEMTDSISSTEFADYFKNLENNLIIPPQTPILTDNYSPVEYLIGKVL